MRGHESTRADCCVPPHRLEFSDTVNSMICWFQFERQDGTHLFGSDPLCRASLMNCKYITVTPPLSQCLFFRGENNAWAKTAGRFIIKTDGN
jgi:hypothetical protein